jgi:hypothetical protein
MPMRRTRHRRRETEGHGFLFFAVGALTGVTAGVLLARRYRTGRQMLEAMRSGVAALREYWDAAGEIGGDNGRHERDVVDAYEDEYFDDENEMGALPPGTDTIEANGIDDIDADELDEDVEDEIVDTPAATRDRSTERALEARVLDAFLDDEILRDRPVDIAAVGNGVIELTGTVRSLDEAARAASCARRVAGVSMVLNRVQIGAAGDTASVPVDPAPTSASSVVRPVTPDGPAA